MRTMFFFPCVCTLAAIRGLLHLLLDQYVVSAENQNYSVVIFRTTVINKASVTCGVCERRSISTRNSMSTG